MARRTTNDYAKPRIDPNLPQIDVPIAGFYKVRLVKGGPWCSARIWYGIPNDPLTGEPLDRGPRWQALRCGQDCDVYDLWPFCIANKIDEGEYNYLLSVEKWAINAPDAPEADPRKAIDLLTVPIPF
jgi:hypothetical protein